MSPTKRASAVPGLRSAIQAAPPLPPAERPERPAPAPSPASETPAPVSPRSRPRPPKPIRYTLDLDPAAHAFLKRFALDAGVTASAVVRVLLGQLREDEDMAARVRAEVWEDR